MHLQKSKCKTLEDHLSAKLIVDPLKYSWFMIYVGSKVPDPTLIRGQKK